MCFRVILTIVVNTVANSGSFQTPHREELQLVTGYLPFPTYFQSNDQRWPKVLGELHTISTRSFSNFHLKPNDIIEYYAVKFQIKILASTLIQIPQVIFLRSAFIYFNIVVSCSFQF